MVKLGLSLAWTYLANNPAGRCSNKWTDFFGNSRDFLELLEKEPVTSIEFRHFDEVENKKTIHSAAKAISETSFNATVHGDINYKDIGRELFDIFPWYPILLSHIPEKIKNTVITLHPVLSPDNDMERSKELSVCLINDLLEMTDKEGIQVRFSLEIQRNKGLYDPGTTYDGIMEIHRRVNNPRLGVNWDMGHTQSNVNQGKLSQYPGQSFLAEVNHTHIHDLNLKGQTHWPLTQGRIPLAENVKLLERVSYNDIYNLELATDRFAHEKDAGISILKSISILNSTIITCKNELSEEALSSI
ncbi:MAG TPA: hypothetical protein DCO79_07350 [Spirochaeta sp.]|nr:hypothetical protein [Spirochaeta sp.]